MSNGWLAAFSSLLVASGGNARKPVQSVLPATPKPVVQLWTEGLDPGGAGGLAKPQDPALVQRAAHRCVRSVAGQQRARFSQSGLELATVYSIVYTRAVAAL